MIAVAVYNGRVTVQTDCIAGGLTVGSNEIPEGLPAYCSSTLRVSVPCARSPGGGPPGSVYPSFHTNLKTIEVAVTEDVEQFPLDTLTCNCQLLDA